MIRTLQIEDASFLHEIFKDNKEYEHIFFESDIDLQEWERRVSLFIKSMVVKHFIIEMDGRSVGWFSYEEMEGNARGIGILVIKRDYLNLGYGTCVLQEFLKQCEADGIDRVYLSVNKDNERAIHLYQKLGFEVYAEEVIPQCNDAVNVAQYKMQYTIMADEMTDKMSEKEKMEAGLWYDANYDEELLELRLKAEDLCFDLNQIRPRETEKRAALLKELIPDMEENCVILSPLIADYGCYTKIGHDTFINHNAYLMDGGGITIGSHCFIGPNCGLYTAVHATVAEERNQGLEKALPIVIGDNCWFGGDVKVLPGVTIGNDTIIGAGSVVTKDIPDHVVAAGNPCRILRPITDADRIAK